MVDPTWDEIARLAAIRTGLNFFLGRELAEFGGATRRLAGMSP